MILQNKLIQTMKVLHSGLTLNTAQLLKAGTVIHCLQAGFQRHTNFF
jgi:hypothetical protein